MLVNSLEYSRPTASRNWGWCSGRCNTDTRMAKNLKETQINILSFEECKVMGKGMNVKPSLELCGGKKRIYPKTDVYYRTYSKKKKIFWFRLNVSFNLMRTSNYQTLSYLYYFILQARKSNLN